MKTLLYLLTIIFFISCNEVASNRSKNIEVNSINSDSDGNCLEGTNCATPSNGAVSEDVEQIISKVEIRHLVEPKIDENDDGGDYTKKLTIPKNYNGLLFIAGINLTTLSDKQVKVRFKFGLESNEITIPATVSQAAGLTSDTNVEVLVLDLRSRPFEDIRLIYDLYDYNDYTFLGGGEGALTEPVQDNRDEKLFCRGLALKDDSTFKGSLATGCKEDGTICKFAYAKVVDKGLVRDVDGVNVPISPREANIQSGTVSLYSDSDEIALKRCLPDDPTDSKYVYNINPDNGVETKISFGDNENINGLDHFFLGPYSSLNFSEWEINEDAAKGRYGIFRDTINNSLSFGKQSNLFPIAATFELESGVQYLGSEDVLGERTLQTMPSTTETEYMDGCNVRATTIDDNTGEHIGSCTVSASIDIITLDDDGNEFVVNTSKDVKLQLVKSAEISPTGENLLLSSFQSCSSSNQCGSESCCFNGRCWSKTIVSQCVDEQQSFGNRLAGDSCSFDHQCSSLCCKNGVCGVHNNQSEPPVLCSKSTGQFCIAKEWCEKVNKEQCFIVLTGTNPRTCNKQCFTFQEHADCVEGICRNDFQSDNVVFDPNDPNVCNDALTPAEVDALFVREVSN